MNWIEWIVVGMLGGIVVMIVVMAAGSVWQWVRDLNRDLRKETKEDEEEGD
jgi:hypothetical protein